MKQPPLSPLQLQLLTITITEKSGTDIQKLYKEKTGTRITAGALYTTLRRMNQKKLITKREEKSKSKDTRVRYYQTTKTGQAKLTQAREYYQELSKFQ